MAAIEWGSMLQDLLKLAGQDDQNSRTVLVDQLADMFLGDDTDHTDNEEELFTDVMTDLINGVDQDAQIRVANKFADADATPRPMARRLAFNDEPEVAAPVLERSNVLTEDDLVEVAESKSEDHLMAITKRPQLSERLTDAIIDRDMDAPISSAARNLGASFSESGFEKMVDKAASGVGEIADALSFRQDVPADVADKLLENLPPAAKVRFLSLMCNDEAGAADMIREAAFTVEKAARQKRATVLEAKALVAEIQDGTRNIDEALGELAEARQVDTLCVVLGDQTGLKKRRVESVLKKPDSTAFVVLCRALSLETDTFRQLFKLRSNLLMKRYDLDKAAADYQLIDVELANQTLDHLRRTELAD
ncbi:MAG: DUF2336 domain-containing protein [Pseudomonadota bacterium]